MLTNDSTSVFAGVIGLGALKQQYKNTGSRRWIGIGFGVICLLATPVLLLIGALVAYQAYNDAGLYRVADAAALPFIAALVAFIIGAAILISAWRSWGLSAALFENGIAYQTRNGLQQANWADVTAVWQR